MAAFFTCLLLLPTWSSSIFTSINRCSALLQWHYSSGSGSGVNPSTRLINIVITLSTLEATTTTMIVVHRGSERCHGCDCDCERSGVASASKQHESAATATATILQSVFRRRSGRRRAEKLLGQKVLLRKGDCRCCEQRLALKKCVAASVSEAVAKGASSSSSSAMLSIKARSILESSRL